MDPLLKTIIESQTPNTTKLETNLPSDILYNIIEFIPALFLIKQIRFVSKTYNAQVKKLIEDENSNYWKNQCFACGIFNSGGKKSINSS